MIEKQIIPCVFRDIRLIFVIVYKTNSHIKKAGKSNIQKYVLSYGLQILKSY